MKKFFKYSLIFLSVCILALVLLLFSITKGLFGKLPTEAEIASYRNAYASQILASDGSPLGLVHSTYRLSTEDQQIPEHVGAALVAIEDKRFYEHKGVDYFGLFRVAIKNILLGNRSAGGGSTLSQQLVKNIYGRSTTGWNPLFIAKFKEMIVARRFERVLSKDEIITLYLNTVPFGENQYGIEAASRRFFNKKAEQLNIQEAATLIGMLKANSYYNPRLRPKVSMQRRNTVLHAMQKMGILSADLVDSLAKDSIVLHYTLTNDRFNGYVNYQIEQEAREILEDINSKESSQYELEKDGLIIETTVNSKLQELAAEQMLAQLERMQKQLRRQYRRTNVERLLTRHFKSSANSDNKDSLFNELVALHGGFLAMDAQTGRVYAYIGGKDFSRFPFDQAQAKRTMASTFKPFLYAAALEQGYEPCDYIDNHAVVLSDYDGWQPQNYDKKTGGSYTLAGALAKSLNIPTVRLYLEQDPVQLRKFWDQFPFSSKLKSEPSAALGTTDASIYEVAQAYSAFPNKGVSVKPFFIERILNKNGEVLFERSETSEQRSCSKGVADIMCAMLQLGLDQGTSTSLRSQYNVSYPFAAKTGTSQSYADAWIVGFNQELVLVTRIGANNPAIHFDRGSYGSSTKLALPVLGNVLRSMDNQNIMKAKLRSGFTSDQIIEWDCVHFKEDNALTKIKDIFKPDETNSKTQKKKLKRKRKFRNFKKKLKEIFD